MLGCLHTLPYNAGIQALERNLNGAKAQVLLDAGGLAIQMFDHQATMHK